MDLTGRLVRFWLSPDGRAALGKSVPTDDAFEALVVEEDHLGLWIWLPESDSEAREVILLKWDYFAAARLEYQPEVPAEKPQAGFRRPK